MVGLQMEEVAPGNTRGVLLELGIGTTVPCSLVAKPERKWERVHTSYCLSTTELQMLLVVHMCMYVCVYELTSHHYMVLCGPQLMGMMIVGIEVNIIFCHSHMV